MSTTHELANSPSYQRASCRGVGGRLHAATAAAAAQNGEAPWSFPSGGGQLHAATAAAAQNGEALWSFPLNRWWAAPRGCTTAHHA
ncbi:unnamed protein product [Prunus armeniaca]|uniref:Uncharacterized protein n=1 Tax=Prunus armeniaca TaxID=36596 RepID=A0A6J5U805_PRUAR|nr:unnamed protein product [Prunus armeniaca]